MSKDFFSNSLLIQNGLVIDPASNQEAVLDLRIADGTIIETGKSLAVNDTDKVFDAKGFWVCPGFIDLHSHLRDLGEKDKEDLETGTKAAAAGGFTTVVAMANTTPPLDNTAVLSLYLQTIAQKAHIEVLPVACVTRNMRGAELTDMCALAEMGAIAFSDDGKSLSNMAVLRKALEYVRLTQRPIISHAEDLDLCKGGVIHEGLTSYRLGLPGIPAAAEAVAVAREIEIVRLTATPYHFTHISTASAVNLIRKAKEDGLPITADVTPHHLTLTVDDIVDYNSYYKVNPPLRTEVDQRTLLTSLKDGTLDAIATDHAPHTKLNKSGSLSEAAVGLIGLETAFSLTYEKLVVSKQLLPLSFIALLTTKPAKVLSLPVPNLQVGATANIAVLDPNKRWTYRAKEGFSRSENTPFDGKQLTGKLVLTIYQGRKVFEDKELTTSRAIACS